MGVDKILKAYYICTHLNTEGGEKVTVSSALRNCNSYFQIVERYSALLRKMSFIHSEVIKEFATDIEACIGKIESLMLEVENSDNKTQAIFELRRLIFKLEDIIDHKVIQKYNQLIDGGVSTVASNISNAISSASAPQTNGFKQPKDVWDSVSSYLQNHLNVHTYNVWVKPIEYHSCDNKKIKIVVQNQFYKNWLEEHCSKLIKKHLNDINVDYEIAFVTE